MINPSRPEIMDIKLAGNCKLPILIFKTIPKFLNLVQVEEPIKISNKGMLLKLENLNELSLLKLNSLI